MADESLTDRIVRGAGATFGAQVLGYLSKGALTVVLARTLLTRDEFGLLFYALSVAGFGVLFAELGLAKSGARYLAEYDEQDPGQVPHVLRVTLLSNFVPIAVTALAFAAFGPVIARWAGDPQLAPFMTLAAVYIALRALFTFLKLSFQGFNRVTWSALIGAVSSVGKLVFAVAFVLLGFEVVGAFAGYVASVAVAVVVGFVVLYRKFYATYSPADAIEDGLARRIVEYSVPLTLTRGAGILDQRVDTVLVGAISGPAAVAYYTLGKQISQFAIAPATSLGFVVSPAYGEQKAGGDLARAASLYQTSLEHVLLLYVPAAAGLVLVAEPLVTTVFGESYLGAVLVVQLLAGFVVVKAVDKITNDGLDYLGRARARAIVKSGGSVANFLLNLLLIPLYGAAGAAGATVVTTTAVVAANVYLIHRQLSLDGWSIARTVLLVVAITAPMAVVVELVLATSSGLATLAAAIAVGVAVWAVLAVLSGLVDPGEVRTLLS